ncbi:hypothetical protein [Streptomyces virginiae]|uniref:hypothetical protein n=1 Tax=Streptomyces virginiae TaxID=1961 RepID=UPI00341EE614
MDIKIRSGYADSSFQEFEAGEIRWKTSDRVGTAGKGNAKARTWKAPRKSDAKESDRVGNARQQNESPEESPRG